MTKIHQPQISPAAQAANEIRQLHAQVERLKQSLLDEWAGRQRARQSRKRLVRLVRKWRSWDFLLLKEHARQFQRAEHAAADARAMAKTLQSIKDEPYTPEFVMNRTIRIYNKHGAKYITGTVDIERMEQQASIE